MRGTPDEGRRTRDAGRGTPDEGIEPDIAAAAELVDVLPGLRIPVATPGHLLALKVLSFDDRTRPQDRLDVQALLAVATPDDIAQARGALARIEMLGFARQQDLAGKLGRLLGR